MKRQISFLFAPAFLLLLSALPALAQERIFRCGNEYTNNAAEAKVKGCKVVEGGNVTVVSAGKAATPVRVAAAAPAGPRSDAAEQRARDADSRFILEAELKKAEARAAELQKEFNNGEPEKQGQESRNHQKYLDRTAELKASVARAESDVAGLKRELARLPANTSATPSAATPAPTTLR